MEYKRCTSPTSLRSPDEGVKHSELSSFPFESAEEVSKRALEEAVKEYEVKRDRLSGAIAATGKLVDDFRSYNSSTWEVRYPQAKPFASKPASGHLRRTLSVAQEPSSPPASAPSSLPPAPMSRAMSTFVHGGQRPKPAVDETKSASPFQVLDLSLSLGPSRSSRPLVMSLERSSVAKLLDGKLETESKHLQSLQDRIHDTSSKVLVTGDLNSGKSTFVNALLRRDVLPVDEQPCTTMFCTVHDARDNGGLEEVHVDREGAVYDRADESTFDRLPLKALEELVVDSDSSRPPIKVYVADTRSASESLIHNGVVDISLIDAPGLNVDSLKTTAVFARQDEIDVVVFCVSAANHFTLSAKEFIWTASNEKAYLFIVVNRFDQIKDKARCKRLILDQIRQLSPRTYEDAEELVHFVDSNSIMAHAGLGTPPANDANAESFEHLEAALRSFVLDKRAKSKLLPAQTFVSNLLSDLDLLASTNVASGREEVAEGMAELAKTRPVLEEMKKGQDGLERGLEATEDAATEATEAQAKNRLSRALEAVGRGEIATGVTSISLPAYSGFFDLWEWAQDVKATLLLSLDAAVSLAEDDARRTTGMAVDRVRSLEQAHLPAETTDRPRKEFKPENMFRKKSRRSVSVGTVGLGLGLAQRQDLVAVSLGDLFDLQGQLARITRPFDPSAPKLIDDGSAATTTIGFTALGAIGLVTGKTVSTRTLVEAFYHAAELLKSPAARRWAGPVVALVTVGVGCYVVSELPRTIPRRIGASLKDKLAAEDERFVERNAARVGRETKAVLREAAWELRLSFTTVLEERTRDVKAKEEMVAKAEAAVAWFEEILARTEQVREEAWGGAEKVLA